MPPDSTFGEFAQPKPESLVAFRHVGPTVFATITTSAISSVEAPIIDERLRQLLIEAPPTLRHLVLDIEQVGMVNSMALGVFIGVYTTALHRNIRFVLTGVSSTVLDLLETTKMDKVLNICRDASELDRMLR